MCIPARAAMTVIHKSLVLVRMLSLRNISNVSQVPCLTELIRRGRIEVPRVDYQKLSGDRVGESSEAIRARVQTARNIQQTHSTNPDSRISTSYPKGNNGSSSDMVCNADMRVGEIRQFGKLKHEGQSLMRAATSCCA